MKLKTLIPAFGAFMIASSAQAQELRSQFLQTQFLFSTLFYFSLEVF